MSHPSNGATVANVTEWLKLVQAAEGEGSRSWQVATTYLKRDGFLVFAGARPVESRDQWVAELDDATKEFINPTAEWWAELQLWCDSTRFRAVQDMAFHDRQTWIQAWMIRGRPTSQSPPLECYERWLQHREELDIGYVLATPGIFGHYHVTCTLCYITAPVSCVSNH